MKPRNFYLSIPLLIAISFQLIAQEACVVLIPEISDTYSGKCKNGLANGKGRAEGIDTYEGKFSEGLPHGRGTYTWANGNTYTGEWFKGKRQGPGTLTVKLATKDSIVDGLWDDDRYLGPKPKAPRVITKVGVDRYSFKKLAGTKDRVLIDIKQNGMRNTTVTNFSMTTSNGVETNLGFSVGYDYIDFPVTIRVTYVTQNKMRTQTYQVIFEFEISEPGDWIVEIHN